MTREQAKVDQVIIDHLREDTSITIQTSSLVLASIALKSPTIGERHRLQVLAVQCQALAQAIHPSADRPQPPQPPDIDPADLIT